MPRYIAKQPIDGKSMFAGQSNQSDIPTIRMSSSSNAVNNNSRQEPKCKVKFTPLVEEGLKMFEIYTSYCNSLLSKDDHQLLRQKFNNFLLNLFIYFFYPIFYAFKQGIDGVPFPINIFFSKKKKKVVPKKEKVKVAEARAKKVEVKEKKLAEKLTLLSKTNVSKTSEIKLSAPTVPTKDQMRRLKNQEKRKKRKEVKKARNIEKLNKFLDDVKSKRKKLIEHVNRLKAASDAKGRTLTEKFNRRFEKRLQRYEDPKLVSKLPIEKLLWTTLINADVYGLKEFNDRFLVTDEGFYPSMQVCRFSERPRVVVDIKSMLKLVGAKCEIAMKMRHICLTLFTRQVGLSVAFCCKMKEAFDEYIDSATDRAPDALWEPVRKVNMVVLQRQQVIVYHKDSNGYFSFVNKDAW